jgi:hypothetical protein
MLGRAVRLYRVYTLGEDGRVAGPPHLIECDDDSAAMREAQRILNDRVLEIWNLTRLVAKLEPLRRRLHSELGYFGRHVTHSINQTIRSAT